jgi:hypothetical protein
MKPINEMTPAELSEAVCRAKGISPTIRYWLMNEAETGYSIDFETLREAEQWMRDEPKLCRGEHIVRKEFWTRFAEKIEDAWRLWNELPFPKRIHQDEAGNYHVLCGGYSYGASTDMGPAVHINENDECIAISRAWLIAVGGAIENETH